MKPEFLSEQLLARPEAEPVDAVKWLYQHVFGCGHLLPDEAACAERVRDELAQTSPDGSEPPYEPLGNGLCRLNLRNPDVRALPPVRIARMMRVTAANIQGSWPKFLDTINMLRSLCASEGARGGAARASGALPFSAEALDQYLAMDWQATLPPSHSARYRLAYNPAYRVVLRRYGDALPLFTALEGRLERYGKATLALDGDCAAGKTTLASLIAPLYDSRVFHMDDFFLPFAMRTEKRMAEPGGNVHYERFLAQVILALPKGEPFAYEAFDCHRNSSRKVTAYPEPVTLIEGSYALHPAFDAGYAALNAVRVLLRVPGDEQLRRIRARNGEEMLQRFRDEWIPLELRYIQAYHQMREDELVLSGARHTEDMPEEGEHSG